MGVPIERHASSVYTRAMYEKFSDELFHSGRYAIKARTAEDTFTVAEARKLTKHDTPEFIVTLFGYESIKCSCGLYEHLGMLCRHCLKVSQNYSTRAFIYTEKM